MEQYVPLTMQLFWVNATWKNSTALTRKILKFFIRENVEKKKQNMVRLFIPSEFSPLKSDKTTYKADDKLYTPYDELGRYNVFYPSISLSILFIFVIVAFLKPLHRIS